MKGIEKRVQDALEKQEPKPPIKYELGGGYYYKCHWITCDTYLNKYMNYCPGCGTKIDWSDEDD